MRPEVRGARKYPKYYQINIHPVKTTSTKLLNSCSFVRKTLPIFVA